MNYIKLMPLIFYTILGTSQELEVKYFNIERKEISKQDFKKVFQDNTEDYYTWSDKSKNTLNVYVNKPQYDWGLVTYDSIFTFLKNYYPKLRNSQPIMINYTFKDDFYCKKRELKREDILLKLKSLKYARRKLKKNIEPIEYFHFFEYNTFSLNNKKYAENNGFYEDTSGYLKNLIFKSPSTCGTKIIIKPNNQFILRNGESHPLKFVKILDDNIWSQFFQEYQQDSTKIEVK